MTTNNIQETTIINNKEMLEIETNERLDSFMSGSGKTNDPVTGFRVADKIKLSGLYLWLNGSSMVFESEGHKNAFVSSIFYRSFKDLNKDQLDKLFKHIEKGYLSLNHTDKETMQKVDYSDLWDSINMVSIDRVSIKSKLYNLIFTTSQENIVMLLNKGFTIRTPILDNNYLTIGFSIEYPKA